MAGDRPARTRASKTANDAPLYQDTALGRDGDERDPDTAGGLALPYQIGQGHRPVATRPQPVTLGPAATLAPVTIATGVPETGAHGGSRTVRLARATTGSAGAYRP